MTDVQSWIAMSCTPQVFEPQSLYELSWTYAQDGKCAVDASTGIVVDANPAAEALMGYSRAELIGMPITMLHPEAERERVQDEFRKATQDAAPHLGLHIQQKNGNCVSAAIWSSEVLKLADRSITIVEFRDISEQVRKEHQLSSQNWALGAYALAALALGRVQSSESLLLQSICEAVTHQSVYNLAWVGIAEEGPGKPIRIAAKAGSAVKYLDNIRVSWSENEPLGQGPTGTCLRENKMQIVQNRDTVAAFAPWRKSAKRFGIRSTVAIPICADNDWKGALTVYSDHVEAFDAPAVEVFQRLGEHIVNGIHTLHQSMLLAAERVKLAAAQKHVVDALSASVAAMVTAIGVRDPYTAEHENRVATIAVAIGREMGWDENRLEGIRLAGMVHDIGKIAIPSQILVKPARLSAAEFALIKEHPETGNNILQGLPFTWPVAEMVREHHERLDGSGYPLGLKGDAILPESKVLAVADMVEAMASDRPYRRSHGLEAALRQIESEAGTLLDPEAVRICAALFREKRLVLPSLN
jgi:PAS domain S-box-containing protein